MAELQAFKKGGALLALEASAEDAQPVIDHRFIRAQKSPEAVPLLAKLFSISVREVEAIRSTGYQDPRQRMPLHLLQELVDQRQERLSPEDFAASSSSMALCENEA